MGRNRRVRAAVGGALVCAAAVVGGCATISDAVPQLDGAVSRATGAASEIRDGARGLASRARRVADRAESAFNGTEELVTQARNLLDGAGEVLAQGEGAPPPQAPEQTILGAVWAYRDEEGGQTLMITPAPWTRANGLAYRDDVWAELVANVPEVDVPGMRDQLICHMIGAPDKDTWNIEPWRPAVGLVDTVRARCNP